MENRDSSPPQQEKEVNDGLSRLCALPLELRQEIYSYLLPSPMPQIIIRARYAPLRWLSATRSIFNDVAPSIYGKAYFTVYTKLEPGASSLDGDFDKHLHLTYGPNGPLWLAGDARSLIKHIHVTIAPRNVGREYQTAKAFRAYFAAATKAFRNLQLLEVDIHSGMALYPCRNRTSTVLGKILQQAVRELVQALQSMGCEVRILEKPTDGSHIQGPARPLGTLPAGIQYPRNRTRPAEFF